MSATHWTVIGVSVLALAIAVVVGWRNPMDLHSTRNRRSMRASDRRTMWAAGSAGVMGLGYFGSGGSDLGGGGSDLGGGGCGGGGGC